MLDRILYFSIHNKLIVALGTLALILWGVWAASKLPIDAVPDITNNQVQVITYSPSLSPSEVERLITAPLELSLSNMPDLVELRSISRFGLSVITAVFDDQTEIYKARQLVSERLAIASRSIPSRYGQPELGPVSTGLSEIFQYLIVPKKGYESRYSLAELRSTQDWIVRKGLLGTPGVADVSSFGGEVKQFEVAVSPFKLRSFGLSIQDIWTALEKNNANTGGAYIEKGPQAWFVRTEGLVRDLDQIAAIPVGKNNAGLPLLIRDVAKVQLGHPVRFGALTQGQQGEGVGGIVLMLKGENSGMVTQAVEQRMETIRRMLPEGLEIQVYLNRTHLVARAISTVRNNLMEGALIVIFVLVLILGNLRAGLIVASVIPLAMLFALGMMQFFGVSGNLMSLGAIDFGLIVDGAVIIVEATLHHLHIQKWSRPLTSQEMDREVYNSASKIRSSAAFGEIIILIVYLPLLALVGIEGKMFRPMAQTVAFAIAGAFILSLTYVPMVSALFLSRKPFSGPKLSDRIMDRIFHAYKPVLQFFLPHSRKVILASVLAFAGSLILFFSLGGEFIPSLDEGDFAVETRLVPGTSLDKTIQVSLDAARILEARFPEVRQVVGKIGTSEIPTDPMPFEACDLMVLLKEKSEWPSGRTREELVKEMEEALAVIPGVRFGFQQPIQMRFNELMTGAKQDVAIKIYGEDLDRLAEFASKAGELAAKVDGVEDLYVEQVTGLPEIQIRIRFDQLARYGLSVEQVNQTVEMAFAGSVAGQVYEGDRRYDLVVRLEEGSRKELDHVRGLFVNLPSGAPPIPLSEVADVDFRLGPNQIQRDNSHRRVTVAFNVRGRDVESLVAELDAVFRKKLPLPAGYYYSVGGQFQNLKEAKSRLMVAVPIALLLILALLFFTFHSVIQSLMIFSAIPLSAIGGILALWLRDMPFSISAGVGFIALFGVAVLNGIVLIGECNRLRAEGETDPDRILLEATHVRLRPVLMTALVASFGFLPMALSTGSGAEVQKPLATVVIGGLISATLLTLFVLPALYRVTFRKVLTAIVLLVLFAGLSTNELKAQSQKLSEKEWVRLALERNPVLQSYRLEAEARLKNQGSAKDLGKTQFLVQGGQYNSYFQDQNFQFLHTFPAAGSRIANGKWLQAQALQSEIIAKKWALETELQVRTVVEDIRFSQEKQNFYRQQDSLLQAWKTTTSIRVNKGDLNPADLDFARLQVEELKSRIGIEKGEELAFFESLKKLVGEKSGSNLEVGDFEIYQAPIQDPESGVPATHPEIEELVRQTEGLKALAQLELRQSGPEFGIGYFNQSLRGIPLANGELATWNNRFQGFQFSMSIPWFRKPIQSRQAFYRSLLLSAEKSKEAKAEELNARLRSAYQQWKALAQSLDSYEKDILPLLKRIQSRILLDAQLGNAGPAEVFPIQQKILQSGEQVLNLRHLQRRLQVQIQYLLQKSILP